MTDLDTEEPLSNLSDSSFVILGQGSLPFTENKVQYKEPVLTFIGNNRVAHSDESINNSTKSSSQLSQSTFYEEGIQKKLNELVKENYQLKETLSQNNLAIKSQLDTFFMWQQEVLKTHKIHKQKFLETKELILQLRAENSNLKQQLEDSLASATFETGVDIYAKVKKQPLGLPNFKENVREHEELYNSLVIQNENLNMEVLKFGEELKTAKNEILKLNNEVEDLRRDNMYLKQRNEDFKNNSLESTSHRSLPNSEAWTQISNLLKQLDEEKSKVSKLREELKEIKLRNGKTSSPELSTTEELYQCISKLDDMNISLDKQNQRFSSLQSWVSLAEASLKENKIHAGVECNLICEIKELKSHLNQEENVSREKQETLQELKQKFTTLLDDYKALQLKLSAISNKDAHSETLGEEASLLSKFSITTLSSLLSKLQEKEQECSNMKEEIGKLKLLQEEIDVLKFQIKVYQSDFSEEREAREKLVGEKEDMAEEIKYLKNRISSLEQENGRKIVSETPSQPVVHESKSHVCFKCNLPCDDFDEYKQHIYECVHLMYQ